MHVLGLGGLVQKLFSLTLAVVKPVTGQAVIDPSSFDIFGRRVFDELGSDVGAKVPNALNVLVLGQVFGHVVVAAG